MPALQKPKALATLVLVFAASACSSVNPAGLIAASRLDPLNTPPSAIAVAVGVPDTLRLEDGAAEFRMAFRSETAVPEVMLEETAPLALEPADSGAGPVPNASDERIYIARIAPQDAPGFAALQQQIRYLRAEGVKGDGSLTVSLVGGCYVGAPPETLSVSTWLRTDPAGEFVLLTRRQDLAHALGAEELALLEAQLTPCPD